jgi:hypothetical protein
VKLYKPVSLIFMVLFAVTGLLFLSIPDKVLVLFNNLSPALGMPQSPLIGLNFYLILAAGYMYLVTILAYMMFRHPEERIYSLLLTHGKIVSSILSLGLFLFHEHYLIYLANFIIDGFIGLVALTLHFKMRQASKWAYR